MRSKGDLVLWYFKIGRRLVLLMMTQHIHDCAVILEKVHWPKGFKLFQMNVKSAFLNDFIEEEVFVKQPPGCETPNFSYHVLSS